MARRFDPKETMSVPGHGLTAVNVGIIRSPIRASILPDRDRLTEVLAERDRAGKTSYQPPDDALLREMMSVATGEAVPDDYIAMMRQDLTADSLQSRSLK
jgi:hypothetical protein